MPYGEISIRPNCAGVPCASRGFPATGKRISLPLTMVIMIWPSRKTADRALSIKTLMPLLNNKPLMLSRKRLGLRQLSHLKPLRLAQFHSLLHFENCLPPAVANVNMYGPVLVAVDKEPVAVSFENLRPVRTLTAS